MPFVYLKGVSLTYRLGKETTLALADATLSIDKGEFVAVVGPSGCGKSTIMKLVTGLLPASSGEVRVAGEKVTGPIKGVGMAFQNPTLMPWRTTLRNILLPSKVSRSAALSCANRLAAGRTTRRVNGRILAFIVCSYFRRRYFFSCKLVQPGASRCKC